MVKQLTLWVLSLSFKGSSNETAVLCTENRTYEIKEAETSNSLLLVPDLMLADDTKSSEEHGRVIKRCCVTGIFHSYYEVFMIIIIIILKSLIDINENCLGT